MSIIAVDPARQGGPRYDPNFSASDADVCIVSSDDIHFKVHSTNLRSASSIFPTPPLVSNSDDLVHLDEPARVLQILFAHIYPDPPHPELESLEFQLLYDVAIAADKYQFMMLVYLCEFALEKHSAAHSFEVLRYMTLRGNKRIMDRVAKDTLKFGISTGIRELQGDMELFSRWILYREAVYLSSFDFNFKYSKDRHTEMTDRLRSAVSEDKFNRRISFSATKDLNGWLENWGPRMEPPALNY